MRTRYFASWCGSIAIILALLPGAARAGPAVGEPFQAYYQQHQGMRVLGYPLTELIEVDGHLAQYFEKGRLEDHRSEQVAPEWAFMFGRLAAELIEGGGTAHVGGTTLAYIDLKRRSDPAYRQPAPNSFSAGPTATRDGWFVPFDPQLSRAPGYIVPAYFWGYITRADLFPSGWLHDIGLPLTDAFEGKALKNGKLRDITIQAFERAVLTYDAQNPGDWQVERANIGADAVRLLPPLNRIEIPTPDARITLPLHVLARVGRPGDKLTITLYWENRAKMIRSSSAVWGEDGPGLLIGSFDIPPNQRSLHPWTQAARLEISGQRGTVLAKQSLKVLHPEDPDTYEVQLYWVAGEKLNMQPRRIPRVANMEQAALEALLWGPGVYDGAGLTTALPTPSEVLAFEGRTAEWGPRVTLRTLRLVDGIALADFSQELRAYGGESLRASLIHAQITRTLLQFDEVRDARITIAGERDGALEPETFSPDVH